MTCAGGQWFVFKSFDILIGILSFHHLQADWLISFKLATHLSQVRKEVKRVAVAVVNENASLLVKITEFVKV